MLDALLDHNAPVRALVELAAVRTDDPASFAAALTGVEAFSFMTPAADNLEEVETEIRIGTVLVDAAVAAGVPHVVFNSVFGADRERGGAAA
ncbi:NmrA family NAD(P)-binding protein [Amycolatopsis lexingtonensis]|uniref:NmrA family NAD(P)-binding protein n=1 Tax=Amycolatopsis lexingtonensis TaxID=218822 RepID=UPI003F71B938